MLIHLHTQLRSQEVAAGGVRTTVTPNDAFDGHRQRIHTAAAAGGDVKALDIGSREEEAQCDPAAKHTDLWRELP